MTTVAQTIGVPRAPQWPQLFKFFHENRQTFEFMADRLKSPFARSFFRELDRGYPNWDYCYHLAVCAVQDALKFVSCYELASKLTAHTVGPATFEGFDLLQEGISEFRRNKDKISRRLR